MSSSCQSLHLLSCTPPMIDGVSPSRLYLEKIDERMSLFAFLCTKFNHISPDEWMRRFDDGLVLDDKLNTLDVTAEYEHGRTIYYYRFLDHEIHVPFDYHVIFENADVLVVDKPHFLAVAPAGEYVKETLLTRLKADMNNPDLSPIHRLDRETAGLILISKNPATRHLYQGLFACHAITKIYHAIAPADKNLIMPMDVRLHLERGEPFYTMRVNTDKPANTHTYVNVLAIKEGMAKYELHPITGKLHQLRVHLNHLGVPIKNDPYYPTVCHKPKDDFSAPLQLLAKHLAFTDPISGHEWVFESRQVLDW